MKLKNMWKRFWTLDVHNHEGFTLVELIIVIAILAILSTGAIAGYSAYVEKANKTADEAMIAEIKNVLTLHYYNSTTPQAGYVIIGQNKSDNRASAFADEAMESAYGSNWEQTLVLKYKGWDSKLMDAINMQNNLGAGFSEAVGNSSYMSSTTADLLGEVSDITNTALDFLEGYGSNETDLYNTLCGLYYPNDPTKFNELCEKYNISTKENANGDWVFDGASSAELSNFLVLATAYGMSNQLEGADDQQTGSASGLVMSFASFNAYAKYKNDPTVTEHYNNLLTAMGNASTPGDMAAAFRTFEANVGDDFSAYCESEQYATDNKAFMGMMDALDAISDGVDLSDSSLFSSNGQIANHFNTYVSVSTMIGEIGTLPEGAIVIVIDENGNVE